MVCPVPGTDVSGEDVEEAVDEGAVLGVEGGGEGGGVAVAAPDALDGNGQTL
jgi:hypothetical protein